MDTKRKIILTIMAVLAMTAVAGFTYEATANPNPGSFFRGFFNWPPSHPWGNATRPGIGSPTLTIDAAKAKALVDADLPNLKVGAAASMRSGWQVEVEDDKGVVAVIQVSSITASTSAQAIQVVENSLSKGWTTGELTSSRTIFQVPLLNSDKAKIAYVSVNGVTGEIIRRASNALKVDSDGAKALVANAVKSFQVGAVKDYGATWIVGIDYNGKTVTSVTLGKLNTPTSSAATQAVEDSLGRGWTAGTPRQEGYLYNVPLVDANGNTLGSVCVDGRTGEITSSMLGNGYLGRMAMPQMKLSPTV